MKLLPTCSLHPFSLRGSHFKGVNLRKPVMNVPRSYCTAFGGQNVPTKIKKFDFALRKCNLILKQLWDDLNMTYKIKLLIYLLTCQSIYSFIHSFNYSYPFYEAKLPCSNSCIGPCTRKKSTLASFIHLALDKTLFHVYQIWTIAVSVSN